MKNEEKANELIECSRIIDSGELGSTYYTEDEVRKLLIEMAEWKDELNSNEWNDTKKSLPDVYEMVNIVYEVMAVNNGAIRDGDRMVIKEEQSFGWYDGQDWNVIYPVRRFGHEINVIKWMSIPHYKCSVRPIEKRSRQTHNK